MNAVTQTNTLQPFVKQFVDAASSSSSEQVPGWLSELRLEMQRSLPALDVPSTRDEEWRFTRLKALMELSFSSPKSGTAHVDESILASLKLPEAASHTLVFVDGTYAPQLSRVEGLPADVVVTTWKNYLGSGDDALGRDHLASNRWYEKDLFWALNTAFFEDGAVILVPRNVVIDVPIHLLFIATNSEKPFVAHPRNLVVAGESSQFSLVEHYYGVEGATNFHNVVNDISLGKNAHVNHVKVQQEDSQSGFHIARTLVNLASDSEFHSRAITFGARISRNDTYACYEGQNIDCTLDGLAFVQGKQLADTHTAIDHARPHSRSNQVHKCIVDDQATTVFNGKIFVRKDAQVTRSQQLNQNLVLSDKATAHTKPQLEILADDVVCSHGATIGQLEEEQLFYLQARGIDATQARNLLTYAFAADLIDAIEVPSLKEFLAGQIMARAKHG